MTPEAREREQCRQLVSELMGGIQVDDEMIATLNHAIQHLSPATGELLRRLRRIDLLRAIDHHKATISKLDRLADAVRMM
jgi:hypothetical protein